MKIDDGKTYELIAHQASPPLQVTAVQARIIEHNINWLRLRWRIEGSSKLTIPPFAGRGRADELWRTTCFELFFRPVDGDIAGDSYDEWNFSPSERWNAYRFSSYREGMKLHEVPRGPDCTMRQGSNFAIFDAALPAKSLPDRPGIINLACVIEEQGGVKSFWALAHCKDDGPDFHDPACFTARLEAVRPV